MATPSAFRAQRGCATHLDNLNFHIDRQHLSFRKKGETTVEVSLARLAEEDDTPELQAPRVALREYMRTLTTGRRAAHDFLDVLSEGLEKERDTLELGFTDWLALAEELVHLVRLFERWEHSPEAGRAFAARAQEALGKWTWAAEALLNEAMEKLVVAQIIDEALAEE